MKKLSFTSLQFLTLLSSILFFNNAQADNITDSSNIKSYDVISSKLDQSRNNLSTDTGSSSYSFNTKDIDNLPQGSATSLNQVLLQAPGVAQDSYGQLHVRDDHANLQYRINGIIIPEAIGGFGQILDTHFADKITLLTGALPAEYGYRTAGVIDIKTKTGAFDNGGRSELTVGSHGTVGGDQDFYGNSGKFNYYVNASYLQNELGIESPTSATNPLHDFTRQDKQFGYFSYLLNDQNRLSFIASNATNRFQIPNNPNQSSSFTLNGVNNLPSSALDDRQTENNRFGILALQGTSDNDVDYQISLFTRYSNVFYHPDYNGDLIYTGTASIINNTSQTSGLQSDFSYKLNSTNTLRSGLFLSTDKTTSDTTTGVFPTDSNGNQISNNPYNIIDNSKLRTNLYGVYLQNEWQALEKLTINYGLRFDSLQSDVNASQLSPRLGAVYQLDASTKLHAGYSRYFTPPPSELIANNALATFQNTTNASENIVNSKPLPERTNYYDIGANHKVNKNLNIGVDGYYKDIADMIDEGQFGQSLILTPFNYQKATIYGVEFTSDYHKDNFSAYANLAVQKAQATNIVSGQYLFGNDELSYISKNYIYPDHDQTYTASFGLAYLYDKIHYSADGIFGSGLRKDFANTGKLPSYTQINLGANRDFKLPIISTFNLRLSVINLFDSSYELRDGSGVGVGAPQYGARRGYYLTVSKSW